MKHSKALDDIIAERQAQITREGWTEEHDDKHDCFEMAGAAACYANHVYTRFFEYDDPAFDHIDYRESDLLPIGWPWLKKWWKPKSPRRDLVRAAALLVDEIERMDRAEK